MPTGYTWYKKRACVEEIEVCVMYLTQRFLCHVHKFINSTLITVWHYQTALQETVKSFLIVCLQLWILNMMILVQTWDIHTLWVIFAVLDSILLSQIFPIHMEDVNYQLSKSNVGHSKILKVCQVSGASWISVEESGKMRNIQMQYHIMFFFLVYFIFYWNIKGK